ncbi:MAG: type IX secretion system membrane protein PorP/SprF [Muribaculaceae bacterium]|nr:type IX secretion system membrane protein PorP/SprF [Muribaculaceae bacterium]
MDDSREKKLFTSLLIAGVLMAFLLFAPGMKAQNDVLLTQSWAVPTYYNPAATGQVDFLRIRGGARLQWLGIENAPKSFLATADMPVKIGKQRIGVGADMMNESLGLFSNMLINIQGSYKLKFLKGTLSIGVQGGYYTSKFKGSEVVLPEGDDYHQGTDEAIPTHDVTGNVFDLSAGLYYTHKWFSIGISGLHLLDPTVKLDTEGNESSETSYYETKLPRTLYFTADSNIPLKNTLFELQPSVMAVTDFSTFNVQAAMRARYNKFLSFGVGYRYKDAVSVMVAAEFKNFFIGYSYDYPTSAISKASSGSHEIIAGYQIKLDFSGVNKNKHRSIRIM